MKNEDFILIEDERDGGFPFKLSIQIWKWRQRLEFFEHRGTWDKQFGQEI